MFFERCCAFFAVILLLSAANAEATSLASSHATPVQMQVPYPICVGGNQAIQPLSSQAIDLNVLPDCGTLALFSCEGPGEAKTTAIAGQYSSKFQSYPPGDHSTSGGKDRFLLDIRPAANTGGGVAMTRPHQRLHPSG
jgi:hypothetical protein